MTKNDGARKTGERQIFKIACKASQGRTDSYRLTDVFSYSAKIGNYSTYSYGMNYGPTDLKGMHDDFNYKLLENH